MNETYERYIFNQRHQDESESFELFLSALRKLIKTSNYCETCVNSILRDRIILGIRDTNTQQALLKERKLTLDTKIDICRPAENATAHHKVPMSAPDTVNKLQSRRRNPRRKYAHKSEHKSDPEPPPERHDKICKYCGKAHQMVKSHCPAYG